MTPDLFQPLRGLYLAPIRHHSPACAWALTRMLRELRPAQVLIEMPRDLEPHAATLLDARTKPPVALIALHGDKVRQVGYYPFTDHSPELVALREAQALGASTRFIDLPFAARTAVAERITPFEAAFDSGDFVAGLCRKLGCRDGFELWDHLFESRLGSPDWRGFFTDCGTYCAGLRQASGVTPQDALRETHMAACVAEALTRGGPVVVVIGGFHAAALTDPQPGPLPESPPPTSGLIRYGHAAMDALAGYGAGLPQPWYYDQLWQAATKADGPPDWSAANAALLAGFASDAPLPARVEALRMAASLGQLRGHGGALRHDLIDGVTAAFDKGYSKTAAVQFRLHLRGKGLGEVPPGLTRLPLIEEARARARALRFDLTDSLERRRSLDIRRKPAHRAASQFAHAMTLLDSGFARMVAGPGLDTGRDLLFEDWAYAWTPGVEGRLAELLPLGDRVDEACLAVLTTKRAALIEAGHARDLAPLIDLVLRGVLAGLGPRLRPFVDLLRGDLAQGSFESLAPVLHRLQLQGLADLTPLRTEAFDRLVFLCDELPRTTPEDLPARLRALRLMNEVLALGGLDRAPYDAALVRVSAAAPPPEILGAVLGSGLLAGRLPETTMTAALQGHFAGSHLTDAARLGVLTGMLAAAPHLLWLRPGVLATVDACLCGVDEAAFLTLLPHLRLALTQLNPRETDRLAEDIARLHGLTGPALMTLDPGAMAADRALAALLAEDGLADWGAP